MVDKNGNHKGCPYNFFYVILIIIEQTPNNSCIVLGIYTQHGIKNTQLAYFITQLGKLSVQLGDFTDKLGKLSVQLGDFTGKLGKLSVQLVNLTAQLDKLSVQPINLTDRFGKLSIQLGKFTDKIIDFVYHLACLRSGVGKAGSGYSSSSNPSCFCTSFCTTFLSSVKYKSSFL